MTTIQAASEIEAPVENVWDFVTAHENFEKYIPGYRTGEIIYQQKDGYGTTFRWYTKFLGFRISTTETVVQSIEGKLISYEGKSAGVFFRSEMQTQPAQCGTRFTVTIKYRIPWWLLDGLLDRLYVRRRVRSEVKASLENVKRILESSQRR